MKGKKKTSSAKRRLESIVFSYSTATAASAKVMVAVLKRAWLLVTEKVTLVTGVSKERVNPSKEPALGAEKAGTSLAVLPVASKTIWVKGTSERISISWPA